MSNAPVGAISESIEATVRSAIVAAFGRAPIDAITPINGGASGAFPFRVDVRGRPYLVRIEGPPSPLRNPHQYVSMRMAAEAAIAPRIHHVDETARAVVIDFIDQRPLRSYPGGPQSLARALGELLRRLQSTPAFPQFVHYPDIVARLFAHVRRTGLLAAGALDAHVERLERIREACPPGSVELVSSHNDAIPANVLFDGDRLWLIDWESAYRNDPLVDVASLLDTFACSPELENALLLAWLGRPPDSAIHTRLELIRALMPLYYAGVFLSASAAASWTAGDTDLSVPTPAGLEQAVQEGRLVPGAPQTKHVLGKMLLASFLRGAPAPGFGAAV